jgi:glycosyltransferase involved in cell wall biosynthesis
MNAQPLVSVLMPVYNGEKYLSEAIDSILNQTYTHFEFIIINDGSTDNTDTIIANYNDSRIVYIKNETNIKLIATLNKGLKLAKGKYIARMDADDISMPDRLKSQVEYMELNPHVGICGGDVEISWGEKIVAANYPHNDNQIRLHMLQNTPFAHPSVMLRKSVISGFNLAFDHNYIHLEDYAFWYKLSHYCQMHNLNTILIRYRRHTNQISTIHSNAQYNLTITLRNFIFSDLLPQKKENEYALLSDFFNLELITSWQSDKLYALAPLLIDFIAEAKYNYNNTDVVNFIKKRFWDICCLSTQNGLLVLKAFNKIDSAINLNITGNNKVKFILKCIFKLVPRNK